MPLSEIEAELLSLAAAADAGTWTRFSAPPAAEASRRLSERGLGELRGGGEGDLPAGESKTVVALRRLEERGLGDLRPGASPGSIEFRINERGRAPAAEPRAPAGRALSFGIGTARCGAIPERDQGQALQWAFGYWSGLNEGTGRVVGDETDPRTIADDIFEACGRNPHAKIYEVVRGVYADYMRAGR